MQNSYLVIGYKINLSDADAGSKNVPDPARKILKAGQFRQLVSRKSLGSGIVHSVQELQSLIRIRRISAADTIRIED